MKSGIGIGALLLLSAPLFTQSRPLSEADASKANLVSRGTSNSPHDHGWTVPERDGELVYLDQGGHGDIGENTRPEKRCLRGLCTAFGKGRGGGTPEVAPPPNNPANNPATPNWRGPAASEPMTVPDTAGTGTGTGSGTGTGNNPGAADPNADTSPIAPAGTAPDAAALGDGLPRAGGAAADRQSGSGGDGQESPGGSAGGSRDGAETPPQDSLGGGLPRVGSNSPDRASGAGSGTSRRTAGSRGDHVPGTPPAIPDDLPARQVEMRDLPQPFPDVNTLHGFRTQEERDAFSDFIASEREGVDAPANGGYFLFTANSHDGVEPFKAAQRAKGKEYFAWYDTYPEGTRAGDALRKLEAIDERNSADVEAGVPNARDTFFFDNLLSWGQSRRAARRGEEVPVLYGDESKDMMWSDSYFGRVESNIVTHPNSQVPRIVRVNANDVNADPVPIWDKNTHAPIGERLETVDWSGHPQDYPGDVTKMQAPAPRDPNAEAVTSPPGSEYNSGVENWPAPAPAPAP